MCSWSQLTPPAAGNLPNGNGNGNGKEAHRAQLTPHLPPGTSRAGSPFGTGSMVSLKPHALRLAAIALVLTTGGCIMPFNGPAGVRRDIEEVTGKEYGQSFALTVGRSGMALTRWIVKKAEEEPLPIEGIKKVEIGIYEVRDEPVPSPAAPDITTLQWPEWSPLVEIHGENGEIVVVLSEAGKGGSIRRLLLVIENDKQLVIVRLKGRLDQLIEEAMKYALEQADRPDLVDPSIEEYRRDHGPSPGAAEGH